MLGRSLCCKGGVAGLWEFTTLSNQARASLDPAFEQFRAYLGLRAQGCFETATPTSMKRRWFRSPADRSTCHGSGSRSAAWEHMHKRTTVELCPTKLQGHGGCGCRMLGCRFRVEALVGLGLSGWIGFRLAVKTSRLQSLRRHC